MAQADRPEHTVAPLDGPLMTPVHLKLRADMTWPTDPVFYLLAANNLFLCRNHELYQSCVPAPRWPTELARQEPCLRLRYPKVPQRLLEQVVGFFDRVGSHGAEAVVLLGWDRSRNRIEAIVPEQVATVCKTTSGYAYPIGVHYDVPSGLPASLTVIGDIHSHVDEAAYASPIDKYDEKYRGGLHIVVGRISREPPDFHIEAVVDGTRFSVAPGLALAGYHQRRMRVSQSWLAKVQVKPCTPGSYHRDDARNDRAEPQGGPSNSRPFRDGQTSQQLSRGSSGAPLYDEDRKL